jgi:pSer/pThr/pTyr-binding forkhead associated (FHA) protein
MAEWDDQTQTRTHTPSQYKLKKVVSPPCLEQIEGPGSPREFFLHIDTLTVGRSPDIDIVIDSGQVSRSHMMLTKKGSEYQCTDLNSRNGVFLNDLKIKSAILKDGDTIQLGDVVLIFHEGK